MIRLTDFPFACDLGPGPQPSAASDGSAPGTMGYRYRRHGGFGKLPPELGAHDFGLKDLFASAALPRIAAVVRQLAERLAG